MWVAPRAVCCTFAHWVKDPCFDPGRGHKSLGVCCRNSKIMGATCWGDPLWMRGAANSSFYCVTLNTAFTVLPLSLGIASGQTLSCSYLSLHKRAADLCRITCDKHPNQFSVHSCFALTAVRGSWFNFLILVHCGQLCKLGSVSLLILHLADVKFGACLLCEFKTYKQGFLLWPK